VQAMKVPRAATAAVFAGGALLWAAGKITELGSVSAQSSDPSQRARIMTDVPAWVGVAKPLGLTMMAVAVVIGVIWSRRKSAPAR
jgi:negative regulator of sigma E activity